jgi:hypothetical protein
MKQSAAFQQEEVYKGADIVCASFETHSAEETRRLGMAFANVARLDARPENFPHKIMRVGLKSQIGVGKSTFSSGFIDQFEDEKKNVVTGKHKQSSFDTESAGIVRHVDLLLYLTSDESGTSLCPENFLPAYVGELTEMLGCGGTDLVEHPQYEYPKVKPVDYFVSLERDFSSGTGSRKIEIFCFADKARSVGFQAFLQAANGNVNPVSQEVKNTMSSYVLKLFR